MVLSLATILNFYGDLPDSIKEQRGNVSEYYDELMAYAESVNVIDPKILIPCFINGLNIQIREIFGKNFNSVLAAWLYARAIEIRLEEEKHDDPEPKPESSTENPNSTPIFRKFEFSTPSTSSLPSIIPNQDLSYPNPEQQQQQQFSNIILTFPESATRMEDQEASGVDQKHQISSNNSTNQEFQDQNRAHKPSSFLQPNDGDRNTNSNCDTELAATTIEGGDVVQHDGDLSGSSGVEVGALATGEGEAHGALKIAMPVATYFRTPSRVSPIVARPPELLAAVLPWDRLSGTRTEKKPDDVAVLDAVIAIGGTSLAAASSSSTVAEAISSFPLFLTGWLERSFQKVRRDDGHGHGHGHGHVMYVTAVGQCVKKKIESKIFILGHIKPFEAHYFYLLLIDSFKFYQWDPGGIFNF